MMHTLKVTGIASAPITKVTAGRAECVTESLACEEPLEIRVDGDALVTTMRTPGADHELVLGFLFNEGLICSRADVSQVAHCGHLGEEGYGNVVDVHSAPGAPIAIEAIEGARRGLAVSAACGVCGRRSIEELLRQSTALTCATRFPASIIQRLTTELTLQQHNFKRTGSVHAAGVLLRDEPELLVREDIGRHNALDKVIGRLLLDGRLPADGAALVVSGRVSFEIVQKATMAKIPLIVAISGVSSLAAATAEQANITLVGFARGASFNVYAHPERFEL